MKVFNGIDQLDFTMQKQSSNCIHIGRFTKENARLGSSLSSAVLCRVSETRIWLDSAAVRSSEDDVIASRLFFCKTFRREVPLQSTPEGKSLR